jgi:hypothetical protein
MSDDKGVLGNLPRSRPGRRSDKRAGDTPETVAPADAEVPKPPRPAAAKPRAAKRARPKAAAPPKSKPVPDPSAPAPEATGADPMTEAARAAAKAVGAGVKIGTGLAQEVLRRLPRP